MKNKIIVIVGATGTGKTALSLELAKRYNGEIVCADSRQMYKHFNIGTAKIIGDVTEIDNEKVVKYKGINHYLVDFLDPLTEYNVSDFKADSERIIEKIVNKNKLPIIVGGTGLYIQSLVYNLDIPKVEPNFEWRDKMEKEIKEQGLDSFVKELKEKCPNLYEQTDIKNKRRVVRSLEICNAIGDTSKEKNEPKYEVVQLGTEQEREVMYERINNRVDEMFEKGLEKEVKMLEEKYGRNIQPMNGIGYRQFNGYWDKKISLEEVKELIKRDTRRYAKRQVTWFKRDERILWAGMNLDACCDIVESFRTGSL